MCVQHFHHKFNNILEYAVTILTYLKSSQLKNKTLLVGVFANSTYILVLIITLNGNPSCTLFVLHEALSFVTGSLSFMTLFALNIERFTSIVYSFFHRTKVTKVGFLGLAIALYGSSHFWCHSLIPFLVKKRDLCLA